MTIKLKILLQERASDILYHMTKLSNLYSILKKNQFILKSTLKRTEYKFSRNKFYYLSTARSKTNWYFQDFMDDLPNACILVLDGNKLNNKYKGVPVHYFSTFKYMNYDEMEDRILSNDPVIPNAKSYIKEIHIYSILPSDNTIAYINEIKKIVKDNISIYIYNDRNSFMNLNKKNTIPIIDTDNIEKNKIKYYANTIKYKETLLVKNIFNLYYNTKKINNKKFYQYHQTGHFSRDVYYDFVMSIYRYYNEYKNEDGSYNKTKVHTFIINFLNDTFTIEEKNSFIKLLKKNKLTMDNFMNKIVYNIITNIKD